MNPAVQTKSSDGVKFKSKRSNWRQLEEELGTQSAGGRHLGGVGVEWNRRQLGKNRESTSGTKCELIGRPHLKDKRETTRWRVGHNILKDDWEKTGRQIEDTWRQWADQFWEINQNSGRQQLGTHPSETSGRQLELEETAPQSKTNELPQGETNDLETAREPDTTSQTGRQINCHKGRHMNWRQAKSRTPPARLGDKWIVILGNKNEFETA